MDINLFIGIATGVILFLYGIESFSREIKSIAGDELRRLLMGWTKKPFYGMCLGATVTALMQSSTATSVLAVSLVNAAIINFRQSIGIILGSNIGTTMTAFLVAFDLTAFGPWFIVAGFTLSITKFKYRFLGKTLFYFGLVFFALSQLSQVTAPLKNDPSFAVYFQKLVSPYFGIATGCLFTTFIQSSSVTTGLTVLIVQSGGIGLSEAIPIILGANIGTTFTGIIASLGMDKYAKRAAAVNTFFNIGGVLLFVPFLAPFTKLIYFTKATPAEMTAIAHLVFNVSSSFVFLFLTRQLEWLAKRLIKSGESEIVFSTPYLNQDLEPELSSNLERLQQETAHYLRVGHDMVSALISHIDLRNKESLDRLEKYQNLSFYIARKCERVLHDLATVTEDRKQIARLVRLLRMIDFIQQSTVSQRQVANIPELERLPANEKLTELKAEVFGLANMLAQIYEYLATYVETKDRGYLHKIDSLNARLARKINDKYEQIIFGSAPTHERINSFYLGLLTRLLSIKSKLREVRKLAVVYHGHKKA